jgi:glycosyltransferase involved in cell wall biosynthesis
MVSERKRRDGKLKVAFLLYKPLPNVMGGGDTAVWTLTDILKRIPGVGKIEIFAISGRDYEEKILGNVIQRHIKGYGYPERGFRRFLDLLCLFVFGFRPSLTTIGKNRKVADALAKYDPDLLIALSFQVNPIISKFKSINKNAKIIAYTDSPEVLSAVFDYLEATRLPNLLKKFVRVLFYKRYIKFHQKVAVDFIKNSDTVVTPTEFDKEEILQLSDINKKDVFVIPLISYKENEVKKLKPTSKIKKVVFVGACNFWPNLQAIEIIKQKIAPKLKDIEFIVVGKYCKPQKEGNVNIMGEVKDLDPILREADAFIAPIVSGRGIKTKILTYFLYRRPVIGTSLAFRGYKVKDNYNAIIEDSIDNMWRRICELNGSKEIMSRIQKNSIKALEDFKILKLKQKWIKVLRHGK